MSEDTKPSTENDEEIDDLGFRIIEIQDIKGERSKEGLHESNNQGGRF